MKKQALTLLLTTLITTLQAQLPQTKIISGTVRTKEEGMLIVPPKGKYQILSDSLDQVLKTKPADTTSLFYRALLHYSFNQLLAQPYPRAKGALENLTIAKNMIEKCVELRMIDQRAKMLRAQIYEELCFRFSGDESWMLSPAQILARRKLFNRYKAAANRYLDELAQTYPNWAHDYSKRKISRSYPL
ncbi:hypothetical protein [Pedobacter rhizosphaerae]|uniref:Uncharacterized protein n=1 Tax=Pedobacter rhizosphaerae TaxID=390241 RepID=A0A1H9N3U9_9SPHI|nr:hypothetical protein [Pedobacter rhizosphaerae]SER30083.1 hypothetical protein SAMN04488023_1073 [Pedobacter rhizosphaerae]